ncbi:MAG: carboxylesterase family protein, partial [Deltaproteobacteria bacterium]|nr:carboxylesterase family protein [Deltaproteobacteria bacterium]
VLLFGESAGAVDTSLHVALPSSQGLFQAAIIQSGSPVVRTLEAASEAGQAAVADTSCGSASDIAACLRALPVEDLVRALPGSIGIGSVSLGNAAGSYGPVLDGRLVSDTPLALIRAQRAAPGPHPAVVVGSNSDELAELLAVPVPTAEAYETIVRTNLAVPIAARTGQPVAEVTATLLATYPVASYPTPRDALVDVYTDLRFTCPAVELLAALETPSSATTNPRRYLFARRAEGRNGELPASHGRELLYVFGSWRNIPLYDPTDADRRVSSAMLGAWASLAAQSDRPAPAPTVPLVGGWPSWSASLGSTLVFDDPLAVEVAPREDRCAMWRDLATP